MKMEPNWILQRSFLTPNRVGLRFGQESWTFEQLHNISMSYARKLSTLGLKPFDRVAIIGASTPTLVHIIYGCMQMQLEIVFLNNRLSKTELAYQVEDAEVRYILADDLFSEMFEGREVCPFSTLLKMEENKSFIAAEEWTTQQTVSIMYTSGTTGFPKGVRQTVENHRMSALGSVLNIGLDERDTWLCMVPIFHISGFSILMRSLIYGMTVSLYEKFDEVAVAKEIVAGTITHYSVVAVMLERILTYMERHGLVANERFKLALAGGGPIPEAFLKRAQNLQMAVSQTYGMTETASQTCTLNANDALRKIGSAGKPLFFCQVRIDGATLPNSIGEICVRGPHVTPGYIGRHAELASQKDGWLYTGDVGYLDEDGYLFVVDRRSDLIISGGENIYPAEIENMLLAHPNVSEAGVCGVTDEKWGQVPVAFVVVKETVNEEELIAFCREHLAKYKVPSAVKFVKELPRNGANKLMRRKLAELI